RSAHPEDGWLLRYIDGELPGRKARQVGRHLEACWQCRAEVEELETTIADCVRYRKVLVEQMPAPSPWRDLSRGFDQIDAELLGPAMVFRGLSLRWSIPALAAMALAITAWYELRTTTSVQAAALLRKAVAAAESHPRTVRKIQIRTPRGKLAAIT